MRHFRRWAASRGLKPSETAYVGRARDRRTLRFSKSGKPTVELAYRTHWVSPKLSERKRERLAERQSRRPTSWSSRRFAIGPAVPAAVRATC